MPGRSANTKSKSQMIRLITYDITVDKSRTKIAKRLEVLGLERIQQSVFLGPMDATGLRAFLAWADKLLDPDDRLYAWQLDQDQARDIPADQDLLYPLTGVGG